MWKKILIVVSVLAAVLVAAGIAASAESMDKSTAVNWGIAGSILNGIEVMDLNTGQTAPFTLLTLSAKGSPGTAQVQAVGTTIPAQSPSGLCPEGTDLELRFAGGFVATFADLSMLFASIDDGPDAKNALCVDFQGPSTGVFDYVVTGGTGRFVGASGGVTVRVTSTWDVSPALSAEVGEIVGTIDLP